MEQDDALLGYKRGQYKTTVAPLIKNGGLAISFGWNTVGMGKGLGFGV